MMEKEQLKQWLIEGKSSRKIGEIVGLSGRTVCYWIKKYDLKEYSKFQKRVALNLGKIDTREKAYALGFILCDGHIDEKSMVSVAVAQKDKEIVEFICTVIDSTLNFDSKFNAKQKQFPNYFTSRKINDIKKFTGGRLKTERHYPRVPKELERYLLQGAFDADGCITWGRRKDRNRIWQKVSFTSQQKILLGIQQAMYKNIGVSSMIAPKGNEKCYVMSICSKEAVLKFFDYIYPDEDFIISHRKYEKFQALRLELEEFGGTTDRPVQYRAEPTE